MYVVFFVTERCTASCSHCLLGDREAEGDELSLDEIERWAEKMPPFYFLLPTGGEPFLREDLPDIVRVFVRRCGVGNVGIPTNGSLTGAVVEGAGRMLAENPGVEFAVDVSFDDIGEAHDRSRNCTGLFVKARETFLELKKLAAANGRFNLNAALTVSSLNQDRLPEIVDYLVNDLGAANINHLLVRGKPRDASSLGVDAEKYRALNSLLDRYISEGKLRGYSGYGIAGGINAMKSVRQDVIARTYETGEGQVACRAGTLGAVVRPGGDVYPCENIDLPMGNLRASGYDFRRVWRSAEARKARGWIKETDCNCTYECFMTLNVLFDPASAIKIGAKAASRTAGRRAGGEHA